MATASTTGYCERCAGRADCEQMCKRVRQIANRKSKKKPLKIVYENRLTGVTLINYQDRLYGTGDNG